MQLALLIVIVLVPGVGLLAYAFSVPSEDRLRIIGMSVLFGAAATAIGILIGFLFGIPRSRTTIERTESGTRTTNGEPTVTPNTSLPNTNLEQISDWLTKVLVGVTLAQIGKIGPAAATLFKNISNSLGAGSSGEVFAGAIIIYSTTIGFIIGWLGTRMWVAWAIAAVDVSASESTEHPNVTKP
jgi:hypothetical protein